MKFCSNCGKQLEDSATICDACGTPTEQLPVPAPSSAPSPVKESPALGIVALILSIIGFLTGILSIGTYLDLLAILCSLFLLWKSQEKTLKTNLSVAALVTASLSALSTYLYLCLEPKACHSILCSSPYRDFLVQVQENPETPREATIFDPCCCSHSAFYLRLWCVDKSRCFSS